MLAVGIIIIIGLGAIFHSPINHQLSGWKLLPEPEKLTELYFTQPNSLPKTYVPGQAQTVGFTVHNLEYQTTTYHYDIIESSLDNNQTQTLTTGSFTLNQNGYKQTSVNISTADLGQRAKVEVELVNQNESIDYLLDRSGT